MDLSEYGDWNLEFTSDADQGCFASTVGYCRGKVHRINLESPKCDKVSVILHELVHILGMWHEHTRADRDKYIYVNMTNVISKKSKEFDIRTGPGVSYNKQNTYDYASIMHLSEYAFSKNNQKTIVVSNPYKYGQQGSPVLGGASRLSDRDIAGLKRYYGCGDA